MRTVGVSRLGVAALGALTLLAAPMPARAATFDVTKLTDGADGTCDADCSLREAVIAAGATGEPDVIQLPAGTLQLEIAGQGEQAAATGDLDVLGAGGTLTVNGAGQAATRIDGGALDRVFQVLAGARLELADLSLQNGSGAGSGLLVGEDGAASSADLQRIALTGHVNGSSALAARGGAVVTVADTSFAANGADLGSPEVSVDGAAVQLRGTSMATIVRSSFSGNRAATGGAISIADRGRLDLSESAIDGNVAGSGGAVATQGNGRSTIAGTTMTGNVADASGGALFARDAGLVELSASTLSGNRAESDALGGGAAFVQNLAYLIATDSTLSENVATASLGGGALLIRNGASALFVRSTLNGNRALPSAASAGIARGGGAVFGQDKSHVTLVNSTLSGNHSAVNGGGVLLIAQSLFRTGNATIAANTTADAGGAIFNAGNQIREGDVFVELANTIVAGNVAAGAPSGCAGPAPPISYATRGHNIDNTAGCRLIGPGDRVNTDAALAPLASNGGPTATHAIGVDSPARDAGDPAICPATDQRGVARPAGAVCDVGAFEGPGPPPPPPAPAPPVRPAVRPKAPSFASLATLPSNKRCVSRRLFRIRLRIPKGVQVSGAEVRVGGKMKRTVTRSRFTTPVLLRNLAKGPWTVEVRVKLADGRTVRGSRKYRTCVPRRRAGKRS
jgi:CSLREA domain-containing protein